MSKVPPIFTFANEICEYYGSKKFLIAPLWEDEATNELLIWSDFSKLFVRCDILREFAREWLRIRLFYKEQSVARWSKFFSTYLNNSFYVLRVLSFSAYSFTYLYLLNCTMHFKLSLCKYSSSNPTFFCQHPSAVTKESISAYVCYIVCYISYAWCYYSSITHCYSWTRP